MKLKWRLTVMYTLLLAVLLGLVALSTSLLMHRNLMSNLDATLADNYRSFSLNMPLILATPQDGTARYLYPNNVIQVEDLGFFDRASLIQGFSGNATSQQSFLNGPHGLRAAMQSKRQEVAGLNPQRPIELTDAELRQLVQSPDGRLMIHREIRDVYGDLTSQQITPYRILVTLGLQQLEMTTVGLPPPQNFAITYMGASLKGVNDTLYSLNSLFGLLLLLGIGLSAVGAYLLAGQALRPLRDVREAAEGISGQNLAERIPEPATNDEVQALAGSLNAMLSRLEASFEAQRRFTSDASHELRTPVTAISGHAGYLLRRTNPSGQQRESLNIIQSESERLTNLIASLLQLARSDSGALIMEKAPVFSQMLLSDVARELAPLASAQNTTLKTTGEDVTFEGDPDRLKQVIINLVGNALKAGARTVTLESSAQEQGKEVRLSVRDDGPGISAEHLARLFDRFYRVEDSRSRDQGGAGLGLSIAKGIVDAHSGRIWLESELGKGTVAQVQLPVGDVPEIDLDDVP